MTRIQDEFNSFFGFTFSSLQQSPGKKRLSLTTVVSNGNPHMHQQSGRKFYWFKCGNDQFTGQKNKVAVNSKQESTNFV